MIPAVGMIAVIVALIGICRMLRDETLAVRSERKAIEANVARRVRQYPDLFPEPYWDKYRNMRPQSPSDPAVTAAKQKKD